MYTLYLNHRIWYAGRRLAPAEDFHPCYILWANQEVATVAVGWNICGQSLLYTMHFELDLVQCTVYAVQYIVYIVPVKVYSVYFTVYKIQSAV